MRRSYKFLMTIPHWMISNPILAELNLSVVRYVKKNLKLNRKELLKVLITLRFSLSLFLTRTLLPSLKQHQRAASFLWWKPPSQTFRRSCLHNWVTVRQQQYTKHALHWSRDGKGRVIIMNSEIYTSLSMLVNCPSLTSATKFLPQLFTF